MSVNLHEVMDGCWAGTIHVWDVSDSGQRTLVAEHHHWGADYNSGVEAAQACAARLLGASLTPLMTKPRPTG